MSKPTQPRTARDLFPARTTKTAVTGSLPVAKGLYQVVSVTDGESGSSALIWRPKDGSPSILKVDTSLSPLPNKLPTQDRAQLKGLLANLFLKGTPNLSAKNEDLWSHVHPELQQSIVDHLTTANSQSTLNEAVLNTAKACDGTLITADVPGTDHGNLACAWAVNEVVRRATGQTVSQELLSTDNLYAALDSGKRGIVLKQTDLTPGSIIISPTAGKIIGHVGIVGEQVVYSNSSSLAKFWHSYTVQSWLIQYAKLKTYFFELDPAQFPLP